MKTAVSLPDDLFKEVDLLARSLGLARSQLYALALSEYLARHQEEAITERINQIYGERAPVEKNEVSLQQLRELTRNDTW